MLNLDVHLKKALNVSLVVGLLLIAINHGDTLWQSLESQTSLSGTTWIKICLTPCVPFLVSLYSSLTTRN